LDELAALRVRICLQGHLSIAAAVQAIYRAMKALHDGVAPTDVDGATPTALMKELTRQESYDATAKLSMK
jgi:2-methylisocitrate lyase-like PEP mutase family enzyme